MIQNKISAVLLSLIANDRGPTHGSQLFVQCSVSKLRLKLSPNMEVSDSWVFLRLSEYVVSTIPHISLITREGN